MKMYKKCDLSIIDGILVCERTGDIVIPDERIVAQANALETLSQKAKYLNSQPDATPMPSLDGFTRKSIDDDMLADVEFKARTPHVDRELERTLSLMDELDNMATVDKANDLLAEFTELLAFVRADYVIDCGGNGIPQFDMPTLGSVLELTKDDIVQVIAEAAGLERDNDDEQDDCTIVASDLDALKDLLDAMIAADEENDETKSDETKTE